MKKDIIGKKSLTRIIILAVIVIVIGFLIFNENGVIKFVKLKNEIDRLDTQVNKAQASIDSLKAEIDSLKSSNAKIEKVAREQYRMLRKNEKGIKIEEN